MSTMFITMYLLVIDQNHWWQVDMTYNLDFVAITRSILFLYKNEYQYLFVNTFLKFMRVISYYLVLNDWLQRLNALLFQTPVGNRFWHQVYDPCKTWACNDNSWFTRLPQAPRSSQHLKKHPERKKYSIS